MNKYKLILNMDLDLVIVKTNENKFISMFFADESNPDYQQYLIDTDGGLPMPEAEENN